MSGVNDTLDLPALSSFFVEGVFHHYDSFCLADLVLDGASLCFVLSRRSSFFEIGLSRRRKLQLCGSYGDHQ